MRYHKLPSQDHQISIGSEHNDVSAIIFRWVRPSFVQRCVEKQCTADFRSRLRIENQPSKELASPLSSDFLGLQMATPATGVIEYSPSA